MAEEIVLTHAEVQTQYQSKEVIKESKTEKGTRIAFKVRTRVNDRVANSPFLFRNCTYFASANDDVESIKKRLTAGSIIEIKGRTDQYKDNEGKYHPSVRVELITPINSNAEPDKSADEDLPF